MRVRGFQKRPSRRYLTSLSQPRCHRGDGPHPNDTRSGGYNTVVHATQGCRGGGRHRLEKDSRLHDSISGETDTEGVEAESKPNRCTHY